MLIENHQVFRPHVYFMPSLGVTPWISVKIFEVRKLASYAVISVDCVHWRI